ncbi:uncharacterized protein J3R85_015477 [Psidium guajava]|nr:uncharacterized protein J3R85_015477 [Psidium guajava]
MDEKTRVRSLVRLYINPPPLLLHLRTPHDPKANHSGKDEIWAIALLASCLAILGARAQQGGDVSSVISKAQFDQLLKHRNDPACPARGFYTYDAFAAAARSFPAFGTTGDRDTRFREVAAFLAQTSHETTGGWSTAPDGPYAWGYCHVEERDRSRDYCDRQSGWPCAPGKKYYGRGPIQITQ